MATSEDNGTIDIDGTEHAESVSASDIIKQSELACFRWTESNTEKLIELFKSYPCLYDTTKKEYHDRNKKKSAHETMAVNFGITGKYHINMCDRLYTIAYWCKYKELYTW